MYFRMIEETLFGRTNFTADIANVIRIVFWHMLNEIAENNRDRINRYRRGHSRSIGVESSK